MLLKLWFFSKMTASLGKPFLASGLPRFCSYMSPTQQSTQSQLIAFLPTAGPKRPERIVLDQLLWPHRADTYHTVRRQILYKHRGHIQYHLNLFTYPNSHPVLPALTPSNTGELSMNHTNFASFPKMQVGLPLTPV